MWFIALGEWIRSTRMKLKIGRFRISYFPCYRFFEYFCLFFIPMFLEVLVRLMLEFEYVHSKRMKPKRRERLSHYVSFTGERCGLTIEQPTQFVQHVFIHRRGRQFHGWFAVLFPIFGVLRSVLCLRIMIASLSVLLDYEKIEDEDDSDASSDEDEKTPQGPQLILNKQSVYKVLPYPTNTFLASQWPQSRI